MRHSLRTMVVLGVCAVVGASVATGAQAATINGKIAFTEETIDAPIPPRVMTINPSPGATPSVLDILTWTDPAPSWSPDGTRIVFSRGLEGGLLPDLWTVDENLGQLTQVTDSRTVSELQPAWSPDGSKIAYIEPGASWPAGRIFVLDLATGSTLALSPPDALDQQPAWSPDGTKIAFARGAYGSRDIYMMNATSGGGVTRLTSSARDDDAPAWSPDGRSIAWGGNETALDGEIWVMQRDGRGAHPLTHNRVPDLHPTWSPDGRRIAFQRPDVTPGALWPDGIWTMTRTGQEQQMLTPLGLDPDWGRAPAG